MAYVHLKSHGYYEDLYDRITVESGRRNQASFVKLYKDLFKEFPDEKSASWGDSVTFNALYMEMVGNELLNRYDQRESEIHNMMAEDEAKDDQLADARLAVEPVCQHCGETGLRITSKELLQRRRDGKYDGPDEVLFMLKCTHCNKNSAYWKDGTGWEDRHTYCPKCKATMKSKTTRTGRVLTTVYTCLSCGHSYQDKLDLTRAKEEADPEFEKDRAFFCLQDEEILKKLRAAHEGQEKIRTLLGKAQERQENKHIYNAVAAIKKLKIAELTELLSPALKKSDYIEFSLDKPEIGRDVFVGFNCLDGKPDRNDNDSKRTLKKLIEKTLADTNWRLMSDGIHYRLGYLSGRLRAYEQEEDLKELVMKKKKSKRLT
jgi:predicted RNA-binding Zn-ribbon protein involved in translation (DUF1610 family)